MYLLKNVELTPTFNFTLFGQHTILNFYLMLRSLVQVEMSSLWYLVYVKISSLY